MSSEIERLTAVANRCLSAIADKSGKILYSSSSTLLSGPLYLLGFNPGGDPDNPHPSHYTIKQAILHLASKTNNDFVDEVWQGANTPGSKPLQGRVKWICEELGLNVREVCAANLVFVRSRKETDVEMPGMADICWPVHEEVLQIVQPSVVLTHGRLAFDDIYRRLGSSTGAIPVNFPSGHGSWTCRQTLVRFRGRSFHLFQIPHLSRYKPKPRVIEPILRVLAR